MVRRVRAGLLQRFIRNGFHKFSVKLERYIFGKAGWINRGVFVEYGGMQPPAVPKVHFKCRSAAIPTRVGIQNALFYVDLRMPDLAAADLFPSRLADPRYINILAGHSQLCFQPTKGELTGEFPVSHQRLLNFLKLVLPEDSPIVTTISNLIADVANFIYTVHEHVPGSHIVFRIHVLPIAMFNRSCSLLPGLKTVDGAS
jgi:hypothetical protein